MKRLLLAIFTTCWAWDAWGAACCASNTLFPSLIAGDERAQFSMTTSVGSVVGDAAIGGGWQRREGGDLETRSQLRLDAAWLLSDRWQVGLTLPLVHRFRERGGAQSAALGVGDMSLNVGFEALPQWSYSPWRPKGVFFLGVTAPTGVAPVQSQSLFQVDATGRGFWTLRAGALFQKVWGAWDALAWVEGHHALARGVQTPAGLFTLVPGAGFTGALGIGWSLDAWRVGGLLTAQWEGAVRTVGSVDLTGSSQWSLPVTLQLSHLFAQGWTLGALYSDSTWLAASNLPLARSVSILLQTRLDR